MLIIVHENFLIGDWLVQLEWVFLEKVMNSVGQSVCNERLFDYIGNADDVPSGYLFFSSRQKS